MDVLNASILKLTSSIDQLITVLNMQCNTATNTSSNSSNNTSTTTPLVGMKDKNSSSELLNTIMLIVIIVLIIYAYSRYKK